MEKKIWHDVSERPVYSKDSKNCNQIVVYGGDEWEYSLSVCSMIGENTIFAPISGREYRWGKCPFTKWAYAEDLIHIQQESGSEDLEGEISNNWESGYEYGIGFNQYADIARHFAKWQKEQDAKLPKIRHRSELDEYAYQCAYDMSNDWAIDNPTWKDVEDACKLGAKWKEQQLSGLGK